MPTVKRGATLQIRVDLDEVEWAAVYPWDDVKCSARQAKQPPRLVDVEVNENLRRLTLTAQLDGWAVGKWDVDLRIERAGQVAYLPATGFIRFDVIAPATEGDQS